MLGLSLDTWNNIMLFFLGAAAFAAAFVAIAAYATITLSKQEAVDARLETERIKQVVAWRSILPENASELIKVLAAKPGSMNVQYTDGDPEALFLAIQFSQILSKANWKIGMGARKLPNAILFGIAIPDATGDDVQTLRMAFSSARIPFSTVEVPKGIDLLVTVIEGAPLLMVGSRAPPRLP